MNRPIFFSSLGGADLNTEVKPMAVSRAMYVVTTKNMALNPWKGCLPSGRLVTIVTERWRVLTSNDEGVPSSTICAMSEGGQCRPIGRGEDACIFLPTRLKPTWVATSAFASRHQKKDATAPAWTAVRTTRTSEPWAKIEPVVKSWRMHVAM